MILEEEQKNSKIMIDIEKSDETDFVNRESVKVH